MIDDIISYMLVSIITSVESKFQTVQSIPRIACVGNAKFNDDKFKKMYFTHWSVNVLASWLVLSIIQQCTVWWYKYIYKVDI